MTEQRIFSFYDQKADAYLPPWFAPTREHAMRTFGDAVNEEDTLLGKHPEDFFLFELGVFDVATGEIKLGRYAMGTGVQFLRSESVREIA